MSFRKYILLSCIAFFAVALIIFNSGLANAFTSNLVMDDGVFDDVGSMSAAQIDAWLNNNFGATSCISQDHGFSAPDPVGYNPTQGFLYGNFVSAGQVIYDAANAYGLNPEVLLATIQKEQSLVTGSAGCSTESYAAAAGYGCPDSGSTYNWSGIYLYAIDGVQYTTINGTCVNSITKVGFSQQVIHAAWLLKFGEQRSEGNVNWAVIQGNWDNSDDPQTCYGGPMTQGTFAVCPGGTPTYYDGYTVIDGVSTHMDTGATAALYWYTPHFSGNENFDSIFTAWFGGVVSAAYYSCHDATNIAGAAIGEHVLRNRLGPGQPDELSITIPNDTGSACAEVHTWLNSGFQTWVAHIATNYPAFDPANAKLLTADLYGTGQTLLYLVDYQGTQSGMVEVHGWASSDQQWISHTATNLPSINPADGEVIAADPSGSGTDSLFYVEYSGTQSGMVEIHGWSPSLTQWASHTATNLPVSGFNPANDVIIATDAFSPGRDEFAVVDYRGTQSGMVEVHVWAPGERQWVAHIATVLPAIDPTQGEIISADPTGAGHDSLYYVKYQNTGSGMVEIHGLSPNLQQWDSHVATSEGQFPSD